MKCPLCNNEMTFFTKWYRNYIIFQTVAHKLWKCYKCKIVYCNIHNDYNTFDNPHKLIKVRRYKHD